MFGAKVDYIGLPMLAKISEKLGISLTDEARFYSELTQKLGGYDAEFIEVTKNTNSSCLSVEIRHEEITIFCGKTPYCKCRNVHEAVWSLLFLHLILREKFAEEFVNVASFLAIIMELDFVKETKIALKYAKIVLE